MKKYCFLFFLVTLLVGALDGSLLSAADETVNRLVVNADLGTIKINKNIYGHFSEHLGKCIYEGYWVGENSPIPNVRGIRKDVVEALKNIKVPVLRWPGGCFADEYHWMDGIGPKEKRPTMINTHWGKVTENNHFGTHEFMDLCEQLGAEPYICGNLGSGTIQEMQQWVEYITFDGVSPMADLRRKNGREKPWNLKYFGVGNENWGCGGNMTPEYYANEYRRFATYLRNFGENRIFRIACGANGADYNWTEILMREATRRMNGLSLHYYCGTGRKSRSATQFDESDWFFQLKNAIFLNELIAKHKTVMDQYDPEKRIDIVLDEWGAWHAVEPGTNPGFLYQQNSLRDALVAGVSLNIMNQHADRVRMANIAQTINVLQAMILTDKEKMILTPTYHVFEMYKVHQDAVLLPTDLSSEDYQPDSEKDRPLETPGPPGPRFGRQEVNKLPALNVSASRDSSGAVHITLCNLNPGKALKLEGELRGIKAGKIQGRLLTATDITAHNTFARPENVKPVVFKDVQLTEKGFQATLPAKSVVLLEIL